MKNKKRRKRSRKNVAANHVSIQKTILWLLLIIIVATLAAYWPTFNNGFTNWDDDDQVTNNNDIRVLSFDRLKKFFTSYYVGMYQPLTTVFFASAYNLNGLNPRVFHSASFIVHILNAMLVFGLIYLLTQRLAICAIVASFFALNPMNVESVAWVSASSTLIYSLFYLASLISYIYYVKNRNNSRYFYLSLFLFSLSLLSKSAAVTLPLLLILIDFYFTRKPDRKVFFEKVPFLILSIIFGIITVISRGPTNEFLDLGQNFSLFERVFLASHCFMFYLIKPLVPFTLSAYYPYPEKIGNLLPFEYYIAPLLIVLVVWLIVKSRSHKKKIILGFLLFLIPISVVLQFVPTSSLIVADRYFYIPGIGLALLLGIVYNNLIERKHELKSMLRVVFIGYMLFLAVLTHNRVKVWKDSLTLWSDVISKQPKVFVAWNNRGIVRGSLRDFQDAITDFNTALKLKSDYYDAYINRGITRGALGDYEGEIADYSKAIEINPKSGRGYFLRGLSKIAINQKEGGCSDLYEASSLGFKDAYNEIRKHCQ
ncbi:MAG: tetratricopeptide repeat protein [bacterium]